MPGRRWLPYALATGVALLLGVAIGGLPNRHHDTPLAVHGDLSGTSPQTNTTEAGGAQVSTTVAPNLDATSAPAASPQPTPPTTIGSRQNPTTIPHPAASPSATTPSTSPQTTSPATSLSATTTAPAGPGATQTTSAPSGGVAGGPPLSPPGRGSKLPLLAALVFDVVVVMAAVAFVRFRRSRDAGAERAP